MKVDKSFLKLMAQSLAESIDQRGVVHLARELIPEYDPLNNNNMPNSLDLPRITVAKQVTEDIDKYNLLIPFLNVFFRIQFQGYKGRKYKISKFRELVAALYDMGFSIDSSTGMLFEDPKFRISRNWGVLQEGNDYPFTFIWSDIVDSTTHFKENSKTKLKQFYDFYQSTVRNAVELRNGRIWFVEGDGILSAFHFSNHSEKAIFAAMDILNHFHEYNRFNKILISDVAIRMGINRGMCRYHEHNSTLKECDSVFKCIEYESVTQPNSISVDKVISNSLGGILENVLIPQKKNNNKEFSSYSFAWGE